MKLGKGQLLFAAAGIVVVIGTVVVAQGGQPAQPNVLDALLMEVRGLRVAMEQMATAGPRVQLALGRLQLQEQRVNTMIRRVESLRDAVAKAEKDVATSQAQLAMMEKVAPEELPPGDENPMAAMIKGFRAAIAAGTAEVQRLQAEEASLQQDVAVEQGRWSDINRALEDLERAMGKR